MQLSHKYDTEQSDLKKQILALRERPNELEGMKTSKDNFIKAVRRFMEMQTFTPAMLHELIDKIEVHHITGTDKERTQRVIIHYRFVGTLDIPGIIHRPPYILDSRKGVAIEYLSNAV